MSARCEDYLSVANPDKYKDISKRFVVTSSYGTEFSVITYGALIDTLLVPDKDGNVSDIMLGMKGLDEYLNNGSNHGSIVGRSANRISDHSFVIDGVKYEVTANDGPNNLHSGVPAYQNVFWEGEIISKEDADQLILDSGIAGLEMSDTDAVLLSYTSPDGAAGFPGNLDTKVMYAWLEDKTFLILYVGETDKATVFAPTNHAYFNLKGHNGGNVGDHLIQIYSDKVSHKNEFNCPDGELIDVEGTDFDCRESVFMSQLIYSENPQITMSRGIDQNWMLKGSRDTFSYAASLTEPESGRIMEVLTNFPGIQIYAGNHLGGNDQKGDIPYTPYDAVCLEAQMVPNAINMEGYDKPILRPGETQYFACGYRFTT